MEPSQDLAPAGEFNGSESGWTTYIGSPIYSEIYNGVEGSVDMEEYGNNYKNTHGNVDGDDKGVNKDDINKYTDGGESDDSMASDASSGPSHLQLICINSEGRSHGLNYTEHIENGHEKILSAKRTCKQVRKTRYEGNQGMVEKKEQDSLLVTDSAASHV